MIADLSCTLLFAPCIFNWVCLAHILYVSVGGSAIFQEPHVANGYHVGQCGSKQFVECYQNPKSSFLKVIVKCSNFFKAIVMF